MITSVYFCMIKKTSWNSKIVAKVAENTLVGGEKKGEINK